MEIFSQNVAFSKAMSHFWINFRNPTNIRNLSYGVWTDARYDVHQVPWFEELPTGPDGKVDRNAVRYSPELAICIWSVTWC